MLCRTVKEDHCCVHHDVQYDQCPKCTTDSNMNSQSPKNEPDPDAIKMFVGQIPRSMDENDLRKMFEEFGVIFQLNVLRDKITGQSKGCCFVTFNTRRAALEAQNALHNIKTLPGMQHPIQMKPADSEKRNVEERKLFVGMLSKKCNETDIRMMFAPFGTIEECTVLREQNGQSKGCAFVTYANKQCAQNAIKAMHQSQTMEGCRAPLVVKFADTQKEKELKKLQQANANLMSAGGMSGLGSLTPQYIALLQQAAAAGNIGAFGNLGTGLNNLQMQQLLTAAAAAAVGNSPGLAALAGLNSTNLQSNANTSTTGSATSSSTTAGESGNLQNLQNLQGLAALASMTNNPTVLGSIQNLAAINQLAAAAANPASAATGMPGIATTGTLQHYSQGTNSVASNTGSTNTTNSGGLSGLQASPQLSSVVNPAMASSINGIGNAAAAQMSSSQTSMDALSQAYTGIQQYAGLSGLLNQASFPNAFAAQTAAQLQQAAANSPAGKVTEGPEGANLFIYHLPQEFSDQDLLQTFLPFGTVISAKVFIDKQTNLSKCFGFVSYDNQVSAHSAIQAMNGFQIGMKRLKVQLKRPKHENKPY